MHFRVEQVFEDERSRVVSALVDPGYIAAMAGLPDVGDTTLLSQERSSDGGRITQAVRFEFVGKLPGAVTRVIDPAKLSWVQHDDVDMAAALATFRMVPDHYRKLFTCAGSWSVAPVSKRTCRRVIEGDLKVSSPVPFVGGLVERTIVSGLEDRLAVEPALYRTWRSGGAHDPA